MIEKLFLVKERNQNDKNTKTINIFSSQIAKKPKKKNIFFPQRTTKTPQKKKDLPKNNNINFTPTQSPPNP
jgi:hypothetical protein